MSGSDIGVPTHSFYSKHKYRQQPQINHVNHVVGSNPTRKP